MARVAANGIELEYEAIGRDNDPPLILVAGLGAQLIDWSLEFCHALANHGFRVIRFDNRDAGLSTGFDHDERAYGLPDFADDTVGLLDALAIDRAHLVGASMGGMIVQQVAIDHPDRVLSLCSIMSTTGNPDIGRPRPEIAEARRLPPSGSREEIIAHYVRDARGLSSPGFAPPTDHELHERFTAKYDRAYRPEGRLRQSRAIAQAMDRTIALGRVTAPTLVVHGRADPLIGVSGGCATAQAIPSADLLIIGGMGHAQPRGVIPRLVAAIAANARREPGSPG